MLLNPYFTVSDAGKCNLFAYVLYTVPALLKSSQELQPIICIIYTRISYNIYSQQTLHKEIANEKIEDLLQLFSCRLAKQRLLLTNFANNEFCVAGRWKGVSVLHLYFLLHCLNVTACIKCALRRWSRVANAWHDFTAAAMNMFQYPTKNCQFQKAVSKQRKGKQHKT